MLLSSAQCTFTCVHVNRFAAFRSAAHADWHIDMTEIWHMSLKPETLQFYDDMDEEVT